MRRKYRPRRFTSSELPYINFAKSSTSFIEYWYKAAVSIGAYGWLTRNWNILLARGLVQGDRPHVDKSAKRAKERTREAKAPNLKPAKVLHLSLREQLANARSLMQRSHPDKPDGNTANFIKAKRLYDSIKRKLKA